MVLSIAGHCRRELRWCVEDVAWCEESSVGIRGRSDRLYSGAECRLLVRHCRGWSGFGAFNASLILKNTTMHD